MSRTRKCILNVLMFGKSTCNFYLNTLPLLITITARETNLVSSYKKQLYQEMQIINVLFFITVKVGEDVKVNKMKLQENLKENTTCEKQKQNKVGTCGMPYHDNFEQLCNNLHT